MEFNIIEYYTFTYKKKEYIGLATQVNKKSVKLIYKTEGGGVEVKNIKKERLSEYTGDYNTDDVVLPSEVTKLYSPRAAWEYYELQQNFLCPDTSYR